MNEWVLVTAVCARRRHKLAEVYETGGLRISLPRAAVAVPGGAGRVHVDRQGSPVDEPFDGFGTWTAVCGCREEYLVSAPALRRAIANSEPRVVCRPIAV